MLSTAATLAMQKTGTVAGELCCDYADNASGVGWVGGGDEMRGLCCMTRYIQKQIYLHNLDIYPCQREGGFFGQPRSAGNVWIQQSRVNQLSSFGFQVDFKSIP